MSRARRNRKRSALTAEFPGFHPFDKRLYRMRRRARRSKRPRTWDDLTYWADWVSPMPLPAPSAKHDRRYLSRLGRNR